MKISRRGILIFLSYFAIFCIGFVFAAYVLFINPINRASFVVNYYSFLGQLDSYAYMMCNLGNDESCETGLKQYIAKLEPLEKESSGQDMVVKNKILAAKTRLDILAEQRGDSSEAKKRYDEAIYYCSRNYSNKPCTIEKLNNALSITHSLEPVSNAIPQSGVAR